MTDPRHRSALRQLAGLVRKEFLALSRDRHGLATMFVMPVMFIIVMSLALQNVYDPPKMPHRYGVIDHDGGGATRALLADWARAHGTPAPTPEDWRRALRRGELGYVIEIGAGFSDRLADAAPRAAGAAADEGRVHMTFEPATPTAALLMTLGEFQRQLGEMRARLLWKQFGVSGMRAPASMPDLVSSGRIADGPNPTAVQQAVPSWLVFGMFFVVTSMGSLLVEERACGALARLRAIGVGPAVLLLSKSVPYLVVNLLQAALMLGVGVWLMPILHAGGLTLDGVDPAALAAMVAAIGVAAVGLGLLAATWMRTSAHAHAFGPLLNVLMGAIGGIMVPTFVMPAAMQAIASWSPMNWGLEGLLVVLLRGGHLDDVDTMLMRLVGLGAACFALAAWRITRRRTR